MPHRDLRFVNLLVATLLLASCNSVGPECEDGAACVPGPISELPRGLTASEEAVIGSANDFGLELLREVSARDTRSNIVLSPFSASMALGMTLNGADGATLDAMRAALGFGSLSIDEINASYATLAELLTTLDPSVTFEIANAVWTNRDVPFHDAFLEAVTAAFEARAESADFGDPATLDAINGWVDESTNGFIDTILESLDPNLVALLLNAIYFEGTWTTEFDAEDTQPQTFTRADGTTVSVPMMTLRNIEVPTAGGAGWSAVELPYGAEAFSMVVVLPDYGTDVRALVETLDADAWTGIVDGLAPRELDALSIPKLRLAYDAFLNDALRAMGMDPAFRPGADFTRMSPIGDQLCIDFVRQKTFLEVDERGTRAAAVTAVGVGAVSFNGFVADRPFVLAIRERLSGTILFVGVIGDPAAPEVAPEPYEDTCR